MDVRYQVFVSSTYEDLIEERMAASQAILEAHCIPAGMELFPASSKPQWEFIKKVIDDSDFYLVISAGRYGSLGTDDDGKKKSYTEMEFDYALKQGKPIIALIYKDIKKLSLEKSEDKQTGRRRLQAFHEKLKKERIVKFWSNTDGLKSLISNALHSMKDDIDSYDVVGWIKADTSTKNKDAAILRMENQISDCLQTIQSDKDKIQENQASINSMKVEIDNLTNSLQAYKNALNALQNKHFASYALSPYDQMKCDFWTSFAEFCLCNRKDLFDNDTIFKERIKEHYAHIDTAISHYNKAQIWKRITDISESSANKFSSLSRTQKLHYLENIVFLWETVASNRDAITLADEDIINLFSSLFSLLYILSLDEIEAIESDIKDIVTAKLYASIEQCIDFSERIDEIEDCLR